MYLLCKMEYGSSNLQHGELFANSTMQCKAVVQMFWHYCCAVAFPGAVCFPTMAFSRSFSLPVIFIGYANIMDYEGIVPCTHIKKAYN